MNSRLRAPLSAALLALLLTGCGGAGGGSGTPATSGPTSASAAPGPTSAVAKPGEPWFDDLKVATAEGKLSAACPLPVEFDVAKLWVAKAVSKEGAGLLGKQGVFQVACEIDAKPAGNLGFLRVWSTDSALGAKQALESFMTGEKKAAKSEIRETAAGSLAAAEATYVVPDTINGGDRRQRALAVTLPKGAVVLQLGGLDTDEHKQMLPAYVLARSTMAARG
ncbi:lipoprotein [Crossiella sp. SN42]|uniref:lipoprotein n=1 Tax=Crossiella sp. SN42 TaxID=2944808 RepID=UPI00207C116A|nr:lipoprotein [Crossiella sp. SN42]MCO1581798.1 lipoprotein [Crossiella sp. SN42]